MVDENMDLMERAISVKKDFIRDVEEIFGHRINETDLIKLIENSPLD